MNSGLDIPGKKKQIWKEMETRYKSIIKLSTNKQTNRPNKPTEKNIASRMNTRLPFLFGRNSCHSVGIIRMVTTLKLERWHRQTFILFLRMNKRDTHTQTHARHSTAIHKKDRCIVTRNCNKNTQKQWTHKIIHTHTNAGAPTTIKHACIHWKVCAREYETTKETQTIIHQSPFIALIQLITLVKHEAPLNEFCFFFEDFRHSKPLEIIIYLIYEKPIKSNTYAYIHK